MSISSRIENMYDNVDKAYKSIADLGIDLTNVDKNLENLSTEIDEIYDSLPKVENETASESVTLTPTRKAQMQLDLLGNTQQDSTSISGGDEYDSPSPDHPQQIHTCSGDNTIKVEGKNLFDKTQTLYQGYYGSNGSWSTSTNQNWTFTQKVEPNTTYTISKLSTLRLRVFKISSLTPTSSSSSGKLLEYQSSNTGGTFTTPSDCEYIGVFFYDSGGEQYTLQQVLDSMQLEYGSTATTYEPYTSQSHLISLGDIELCNINKLYTQLYYKDRIFKAINGDEYFDNLTQEQKELLNYGKWYLHKETGKITIPSTINWNKSSTYKGSFYNTFGVPTIAYSQLYCNGFKRANVDSSSQISSNYAKNTCFIESSNGQMDFWFGEEATTKEQFNAWIQENGLYVYYPLPTPTNTEITDETLLEQLENIYSMTGTTNISQINNDAPFKIYASALRDLTNLESGE